MSDEERPIAATPQDVLLLELLDSEVPKNEREHLAAKVIEALWHFASCPFDHCERCIEQEEFVMLVRDTIPSWHR